MQLGGVQGEADGLARRELDVVADAAEHRVADRSKSTMLSWPVGSTTLTVARSPRGQADILRPHAEDHGRALVAQRVRAHERPRQLQRQPAGLEDQPVAAGRSVPWMNFIAGVPMKPATNRLTGRW